MLKVQVGVREDKFGSEIIEAVLHESVVPTNNISIVAPENKHAFQFTISEGFGRFIDLITVVKKGAVVAVRRIPADIFR